MVDALRTCFVIAPIGVEGSKERQHSDDVLDLIINPVITTLGFQPGRRADHLGTPGDINRQVIERIVNDDLVIADLTGQNANVFYELAIRHSARKRCIHLMKAGEKLPFDNSLQRTIFIDPEKPREIEKGKRELKAQIIASLHPNFVVENPLSLAFNYERLNAGDPTQRSIATLLKQVDWLVEQEKLRARPARVVSESKFPRRRTTEEIIADVRKSPVPSGDVPAMAPPLKEEEPSEPDHQDEERTALAPASMEDLLKTIER